MVGLSKPFSSISENFTVGMESLWNGFIVKFSARGLRRASSASAGRRGSELAMLTCIFCKWIQVVKSGAENFVRSLRPLSIWPEGGEVGGISESKRCDVLAGDISEVSLNVGEKISSGWTEGNVEEVGENIALSESMRGSVRGGGGAARSGTGGLLGADENGEIEGNSATRGERILNVSRDSACIDGRKGVM